MSKTGKRYMGFLLVCAVLMVCYEFFFCDHFIGYMDGKLYYQYLPEFFIEHNFSFYVKFPMGTALCELVFFLAGHLLTLMFAPRAASGYGGFYEYAVGFAGIFYFTVGMVLLFLTLKQLFSEKTAAKTGILLVLGTPLVLYGTKYASFSHIYTFAAGSLLLYLTVRIETQTTEKRKTHIRAFLIGAAAGLLFLIRNVNAVFLLIYLLYDFGDDKNFKAHIKSIFSKDRLPYHLSGGLVLVLPQLLYWKKVTGSFLLNTYAEESFSYLLRPKFYEVLFSDAKGYFIFTPLMILGILGFFFVKKTGAKAFRFSVPLLFLYMLFINSTWWCWWFGGVYGIRTFLDILPYLAVALGAFTETLTLWLSESGEGESRQKTYRVFYALCVLWMVYANLAFLAGTQTGVINETFSNWWELRSALFF